MAWEINGLGPIMAFSWSRQTVPIVLLDSRRKIHHWWTIKLLPLQSTRIAEKLMLQPPPEFRVLARSLNRESRIIAEFESIQIPWSRPLKRAQRSISMDWWLVLRSRFFRFRAG